MYKALLNRLDVDSEEYLGHISTILHNIGILHILDEQYYNALDKFKEAEHVHAESFISNDIDYIVSDFGSTFIGRFNARKKNLLFSLLSSTNW